MEERRVFRENHQHAGPRDIRCRVASLRRLHVRRHHRAHLRPGVELARPSQPGTEPALQRAVLRRRRRQQRRTVRRGRRQLGRARCRVPAGLHPAALRRRRDRPTAAPDFPRNARRTRIAAAGRSASPASARAPRRNSGRWCSASCQGRRSQSARRRTIDPAARHAAVRHHQRLAGQLQSRSVAARGGSPRRRRASRPRAHPTGPVRAPACRPSPAAAGSACVCARIPTHVGQIDCDGGSAYGVELTVDSQGAGPSGPPRSPSGPAATRGPAAPCCA